VVLDVDGYPPAKSEAQSILGPAHPHAERVRRLLEAARRATQLDQRSHLGSHPLALDVIVSGPPTERRSDATNYLGGIADVLQRKRSAVCSIELAHVDLFEDDRQIAEIHFKFEHADQARYQVKLSVLPLTQ
jgi:Holliday junction resolvase RusA-like endonuclease